MWVGIMSGSQGGELAMRIMVVAGKTRLQGRDLRATLQGKDSCGRAESKKQKSGRERKKGEVEELLQFDRDNVITRNRGVVLPRVLFIVEAWP